MTECLLPLYRSHCQSIKPVSADRLKDKSANGFEMSLFNMWIELYDLHPFHYIGSHDRNDQEGMFVWPSGNLEAKRKSKMVLETIFFFSSVKHAKISEEYYCVLALVNFVVV